MASVRHLNGIVALSDTRRATGPPHNPDLMWQSQTRLARHERGVPTSYIRLMMTSLNAGYIRVDNNYIITDANPIAAEWFGMRLENIVGRQFAEVAPKSPMKMLSNAIERSIFFDRQLQSFGRPDRLLDLHVYPTEDGAMIFFQDITEHKDAAREREGKTALLRSLDAVTAQILVLDRRGSIVAANSAWQSFAAHHGLVPDNGEPANYLTPDLKRWTCRPEAERIRSTLTAVLSGSARTARIDYAWRLKGKTRWFTLKAARLQSGGDSYLIVTNEDTTALKQAERMTGKLCERLLAVQEEERQRIAEDLHDSTAQHLVALGLNLMKLKGHVSTANEATSLVGEMEGFLREASKELRTFTYLLHPPYLAEDGLAATLHQYAEGYAKRTGIPVAFRAVGAVGEVSQSAQRCIFRIVQEGLANVYRHASATRAQISLRLQAGCLHLVVSDDGHGMLQTPRPLGVGLPSIKARLRQFGGYLKIRSSHRGTHLHAVVPISADMDLQTGV